jgi:hypothetical protein
MRYEMKNFIKFSKVSNVGQSKSKRDDWKRDRKLARKHKQQQRKLAS